MGVIHWFGQSWFDLLQTLGIIGSAWLAFAAFRMDMKARRTSNLIEITKAHREIWTELFNRPELSRVSDRSADLNKTPIKPTEELFIGLLILHLNTSFQAMKEGVFISPHRLRKDISKFFAAPMPRVVWTRMRPLQDEDFIRFVESCLKES